MPSLSFIILSNLVHFALLHDNRFNKIIMTKINYTLHVWCDRICATIPIEHIKLMPQIHSDKIVMSLKELISQAIIAENKTNKSY